MLRKGPLYRTSQTPMTSIPLVFNDFQEMTVHAQKSASSVSSPLSYNAMITIGAAINTLIAHSARSITTHATIRSTAATSATRGTGCARRTAHFIVVSQHQRCVQPRIRAAAVQRHRERLPGHERDLSAAANIDSQCTTSSHTRKTTTNNASVSKLIA